MPTVLGIDVGEKKIGLAVGRSDSGWTFTRPALLVHDWEQAWPALKKIIADETIDTVLVGLPIELDGQAGGQAARVREFIAALQTQTSLPIIARDERHTSQAVQREQAGQRLGRGVEDSLAAQLLVESYLQESSR